MTNTSLFDLTLFLDSEACVRLTVTLLHFLWQGAVIGLAVYILNRLWQGASARLRYGLNVCALAMMVACVPLTFACISHADGLISESSAQVEVSQRKRPAPNSAEVYLPPETAVLDGDPGHQLAETGLVLSTADAEANPQGTANRITSPAPAVAAETGLADRARTLAPLFTLTYLAGVLVMLGRLMLALWGGRRLRQASERLSDARLLAMVQQQARRIGLRAAPQIAACARTTVPVVVGILQPTILLPASLATGLAPDQLQAILTHELAHIRRYDLIVNLLQRVIESVLFFHPAVWYVSHCIRQEREHCCDDDVVSAGHRSVDYAGALVRMAELCSARRGDEARQNLTALAASGDSGTQLKRRVLRLLDTEPRLRLMPGGSLSLLLGLVLTSTIGLWQVSTAGPADPVTDVRVAAQGPAQSAGQSASSPAVDPDSDAYVINGYCTDIEDQTPLAGVRLRLFVARGLVDPPEEIAETVSDDDGRFEFTGLIPPRDEMELDRLSYGVVAEVEGRPPAATLEMFRVTHPRDELWLRMESEETAALTGQITNRQGQPVVGAIVSRYEIAGRPVPGIHTAVTDEDGQFAITDLPPVAADPDRPERVHFKIHHPDYPVTSAAAPMLPADVTVALPAGCVLTGRVQNSRTGEPEPRVIVAAENNRQVSEDRIAVTDAEGRFRLVVTEGDYNIVVKSEDRVAVAVTDRDCQTGKTVELPPLSLTSGGFIAGRVVNADTGEPVVTSDNGGRVAVGLFGPSHPPREGIISPTRQVVVNDEGRFTLRAAAGENFPYLVNIRGERMAWNTLDQEPVLVKAGETVETEILIETPQSPEEKMEAARRVVAGLSDEPEERVAQIIELNHTVDETEVWAMLIRELVTIGSDAVPQLCAELDATTEGRMLRRLGFALRAIGDPRAVPALIRAIPKILDVRGGDYGMIVEDAELLAFMQEHDWGDRRGQYFDFERPFREIVGALQRMTGQDFEDEMLESISRSEDPRGQILQRRLLQSQARRWAEWWEVHWREYTDDEAYALVDLTFDEEPLPPAPVGLGPDATTIDRTRGLVLSPSSESHRHLQHFFDLDTGYEPLWPDAIPQNEESVGQEALSIWAAENGVDLMCVTHELPDGSTAYVLRGFDLQVREISARELSRIDRLVGEGTLPEGRPAGELLLHFDPETGKLVPENGAFLYVTREGSMGVIEVTDRVTRTANLSGAAGSPQQGVGFFKGVRFNLTTIVP